MCVFSVASTLCDPMDGSPPGSSVHGILQARILEWVALPSSRGSSQPRDETWVFYFSFIGRRVLYHECHPGSSSVVTDDQISLKEPPLTIPPHWKGPKNLVGGGVRSGR